MTTEAPPNPAEAQPQPQTGTAVPAAQQGQDPRQSQMAVRYNRNDFERNWNQERQELLWGHASPFSIYVAAMGNHWTGGSWAHVMDMVQFANEHGMYCALEEIQDRCTRPYDALGTMRNEAILRAQQGYEFICYLDNDVLPQPDALYRLVRNMFEEQRSIMVPYVSEPGSNRPLHGPVRRQYSGIHPVRWAVLSMMVMRTSVFNCFPEGFWSDAIGADEGYHYQKLYNYGHMPFISTEVVVPVYQAPTYPLTIEKQDNADEEWKAKQEQFKRIPDRRPHNAADPRVSPEGVYMPFLPVVCKQEAGGCGQPKPGDWWRQSPVCGECAQRIGSERANGQQPNQDLREVQQPQPLKEGDVPPQPKRGEPGYYRRCEAKNIDGEQCNNKTAQPHGFCHVHMDRVK